jgi:hypothetical protein
MLRGRVHSLRFTVLGRGVENLWVHCFHCVQQNERGEGEAVYSSLEWKNPPAE